MLFAPSLLTICVPVTFTFSKSTVPVNTPSVPTILPWTLMSSTTVWPIRVAWLRMASSVTMSFFVATDMLCTCRTVSASFAAAGAEGSIIATSRSGSVTASQQEPSHSNSSWL